MFSSSWTHGEFMGLYKYNSKVCSYFNLSSAKYLQAFISFLDEMEILEGSKMEELKTFNILSDLPF